MSDSTSLAAVFAAEATELLDELAALLERLPTCDQSAPTTLLADAMRIAHNLKGAASCVGAEAVEKLAHAVEDLLAASRRTGRPLSASAANEALEAVEAMQRVVDGEPLESLEAIVSACTAAAAGGSARPADATQNKAVGPDDPAKASEPAPNAAAGFGAGTGTGAAVAAPAAKPGDAAPNGATPQAAAAEWDKRAKASTVRVETARLDQLMGFAGELLMMQSRLGDRSRQLQLVIEAFGHLRQGLDLAQRAELAEVAKMLEELARADRRVLTSYGHLATEVGSAMKRVRMLPLRAEALAWQRTVRDTARRLDKGAELKVETGDIELDRFVIAELREPFTHLLRNAVDHGLETPAERERRGKPRQGTILIRAAVQGAMVRIEVSDDGHGVDLARVRDAIIRKRLLTEDQAKALRDEQLHAYLFMDGFSTADTVSRISGRGVGLAAVRTTVEALGGRVGVSPTPTLGGSTFSMLVPLSVLSTKGLLLRVGKTLWAIPMDAISRILRVDKRKVVLVNGRSVVPCEGEPLQLVWMPELSGEAERGEAADSTLRIIVLQRGTERRGVVIDEIIREQEFVAQRLPWNFKHLPGVSGAVVLTDGRVAIVADPRQLFEAGEARPLAPAVTPSPAAPGASVLVVDDSLTTREHLATVLQRAGYAVTLAADGEQAWQALQAQSFALVVADVQMPRLNGFDLTRRIRQSEALRGVPIMLVTSLGSAKDIAAGAEAGADAYLIKGSFDERMLLDSVAKLL